jgi:arsenate reductase
MKKAFAWLEGNGIEFQFHDYKKSGLARAKADAWIKQAGWEALLNTKGMTFRQLPSARQENLNAASAAALMVEAPSAIRRPVIETGKELLIGFAPERYGAVLGKAARRK